MTSLIDNAIIHALSPSGRSVVCISTGVRLHGLVRWLAAASTPTVSHFYWHHRPDAALLLHRRCRPGAGAQWPSAQYSRGDPHPNAHPRRCHGNFAGEYHAGTDAYTMGSADDHGYAHTRSHADSHSDEHTDWHADWHTHADHYGDSDCHAHCNQYAGTHLELYADLRAAHGDDHTDAIRDAVS